MEITRTYKLKRTGDITATYHEQEFPIIMGTLTVDKKSIIESFSLDSLPQKIIITFKDAK